MFHQKGSVRKIEVISCKRMAVIWCSNTRTSFKICNFVSSSKKQFTLEKLSKRILFLNCVFNPNSEVFEINLTLFFSDYPAVGRNLFASNWNSFTAACFRYLHLFFFFFVLIEIYVINIQFNEEFLMFQNFMRRYFPWLTV